ncbi:MAG TPA: hypothetical protein VF748_16115 [Candidatus Acidoferrum sp.]
MSDPTKFICGVLVTYERNGWPHPSILQFFSDLPFQRNEIAYRVVPISNFIPAASGRNVFCKNFRDSDVDWLVMIDNDMELRQDFLLTVKDAPADAGIVVPAFYLWDQTKAKLVLCWGVDTDRPLKDGEPIGSFPPGFHELTKCGTGCIFIRPSVLRQMTYPYFRYVYNEDQGMDGTEDIQFCYAARQAGVKIYGNSSIKVGHYHSVELSSLWKWAEKTYTSNDSLDDQKPAAVNSQSKDTENPSVPPAAEACPANVA